MNETSRTSKELTRPRGGRASGWKRFIWDRIKVDPHSGCWIISLPWTAANWENPIEKSRPNSYVKVFVRPLGPVFAHRLSYLAYNGNIPRGSLVLHSTGCISRACVNPSHLRLGDAKENAKDRDKVGRTARGERHGRSKLTAVQVERIREVADTTPDEAIALAFDVSPEHVRAIRTGRYWKEDR